MNKSKKGIGTKVLLTLQIVCIIFIVYLLISWLDVVIHNVRGNGTYCYSQLNISNIVSKDEVEDTGTDVEEDVTLTKAPTAGIITVVTPSLAELTANLENTEVEEVEEECPYTDEQLEILAHIINGEAGSDSCSDTLLYYVGSVALNRLASDKYPNSLSGVVSQEGQYLCYTNGGYEKEPSDRAYEIAEDLLVNGSCLPSYVVYQAEFKQGTSVYCKEQNMYFCY